MSSRASITTVRREFLSLPEKLAPGESLEVLRRGRSVLKVMRASDEERPIPFKILEDCLAGISKAQHPPKKARNLASHYKKYLYGKKR